MGNGRLEETELVSFFFVCFLKATSVLKKHQGNTENESQHKIKAGIHEGSTKPVTREETELVNCTEQDHSSEELISSRRDRLGLILVDISSGSKTEPKPKFEAFVSSSLFFYSSRWTSTLVTCQKKKDRGAQLGQRETNIDMSLYKRESNVRSDHRNDFAILRTTLF